jgi:hypothetical protein
MASLHSIGDSANPFNLHFDNVAVVQVDRCRDHHNETSVALHRVLNETQS